MVNIFPQGLEGTLVIPIFVGLLIMAALTESLGWDFVGVVVPGYLASVCLSQPVVAGIVVVEAALSWALAVLLDRGLCAARVSHPVFGRDRFFLVLVGSVVVRIAMEGFILPAAVARWGAQWAPLQAHRHELFGIGLVLVPLCANRLWSSGPGRGLFQLVVQTALVVAVLRVVLLPFTNFSLAGFDPSYDPLALAFLTSPRAQMALLTTAAVASWCNRRYGWDFHGILVPALLGLAVLSPIKLVATVVEAILIMSISRALLTLPRLRRVNVEGARKVVLCFAVGVAFKMVVARTALAHLPGYRPADLLGFGYMLPSLLAERIWRSQSVILVLLPTLQTAVAGFVVTTVAAVGLAIAAPAPPPPPRVFASLPQAVLALVPHLRGGDVGLVGQGDSSAGLDDPRTAPPWAQTTDGYRVHVTAEGRGLLAVRAAARPGSPVWTAPLDEWAGLAAAIALRDGAGLALGPADLIDASVHAHGLLPRGLPSPGAQALGDPQHVLHAARSSLAWTTLVRRAIDGAAAEAATTKPGARGSSSATTMANAVIGSADVLRPLLPGAAIQLDGARDGRESSDQLVRAIAPYGLAATVTADAVQVVQGARWPTVVLRPGANAVVAAAFASEWGSSSAAITVCEALAADCVLARDDAGLAVPLALALAQKRGRPLLIVRGTSRSLAADALLLGAPDLGDVARPPWLRPLDDLFAGRISLTHRLPDDLGGLRAFPIDAGRISPTALLWCSPAARRILSGADHGWWARDEIQQLVRQRGVPVLRTDGLRWLADGRGAPFAQALEQTEAMVRTSDVAQLTPRLGPARLTLLVDEPHDLVAFAIEQGARRALVVAGQRREERTVVSAAPHAAMAVRRGLRTLLAREGGTP
jgi:hypothetical protein